MTKLSSLLFLATVVACGGADKPAAGPSPAPSASATAAEPDVECPPAPDTSGACPKGCTAVQGKCLKARGLVEPD